MSLKVGIIGNGGISNCHIDGYRALGSEVDVTACCDINEKKAKEFSEKYGIKHYYDNCYDMLKAEKLDLVSVCTWNSAHCECTLAALEAGCHVICEKPMAMNTAEALKMQRAAEKNGRLLMVGFVFAGTVMTLIRPWIMSAGDILVIYIMSKPHTCAAAAFRAAGSGIRSFPAADRSLTLEYM